MEKFKITGLSINHTPVDVDKCIIDHSDEVEKIGFTFTLKDGKAEGTVNITVPRGFTGDLGSMKVHLSGNEPLTE